MPDVERHGALCQRHAAALAARATRGLKPVLKLEALSPLNGTRGLFLKTFSSALPTVVLDAAPGRDDGSVTLFSCLEEHPPAGESITVVQLLMATRVKLASASQLAALEKVAMAQGVVYKPRDLKVVYHSGC